MIFTTDVLLDFLLYFQKREKQIKEHEINRLIFRAEIRDILFTGCCLSLNEPRVWECKTHYNRRGNSTKSTAQDSFPLVCTVTLKGWGASGFFNDSELSPSHVQLIGWKLYRIMQAKWCCDRFLTPGWGCKAHLSLLANSVLSPASLTLLLSITWRYCKVII